MLGLVCLICDIFAGSFCDFLQNLCNLGPFEPCYHHPQGVLPASGRQAHHRQLSHRLHAGQAHRVWHLCRGQRGARDQVSDVHRQRVGRVWTLH